MPQEDLSLGGREAGVGTALNFLPQAGNGEALGMTCNPRGANLGQSADSKGTRSEEAQSEKA